ncbi:hypothetical protein ACJMK2_018251, partial [Sinanodonta woodiana]
ESFESTMRTKLLLQPLGLLILAIGIATQDETDNQTTTTEDGVIFQEYKSDNKLNTTEHNPPLKYKQSSATADDVFTAGNTLCRLDQKCG